VHPAGGVAAGDGDPAPDGQLGQSAADQEVRAALEAEEAQVDELAHGMYPAAVTVPDAS
jgi:hypothetical protein